MTSQQRRFSKHHRRPRAETARPTLKTLPLAVALCFCAPLWADTINPGTVSGLPTGGTVAPNEGAVSHQLTSSQLTLTQSTQRAVINWQSFNIDAGKTVQFIQPNANAAVLNRVAASANMSQIYGTMKANGTVVLMNPNGVYFHQGADINVGSLIVTTGRIDPSQFMAEGPITIDDAINGSITNESSITAENAGLVALVAPSVVNKGAIIATGGRIALSGADRATVSLSGGLYEFAVPAGAQGTNATISNMAGARLEGKAILLSTGDAANLVSGVINLQGVQQASSAIVVDGHTVVLKSDLDAGVAGTISGSSNTIQVHNTASILDALQIAKTGTVGAGATVELQAGTFNQQVELNKANMTLRGVDNAKIVVPNSTTTGVKVMANNVTVQGLEIEGPLTAPYSSLTTDQWGATPNSLGIFVNQNVTGFNITGNKIHDIRTGIRVFGTGNVGSITNNEIENTKGGILFQYTNGMGVTMTGNKERVGGVGNEWGIGFNINTANSNTGEAPAEWQVSLLALANANNQMAVEDRKYATSNRTRVIVDDDSTVTAVDDFNLGNGLGNARQPLKTIQSGINAVVKGGTVQVRGGTYTQASTLNVNKSVTLDGAGEAQTLIDVRGVTGNYGMYVTADDVTLSGFSLYGPSNDVGTAYGIKVSPGGSADARLRNFTIRNVTSRGAGRAELDLNGVDGALIDNVTLNGARVSDGVETKGAGLQLTDSANVRVRNTTTLNNNWGGLAIYQANTYYNQQVNNITIEGNNHFNELNPVYLQDQSASKDFGTLSIAGYDYAVRNATANTDSSQYTWLQATKQKAYDFAVNLAVANSSYNTGNSYIQDWNGSGTTQSFEVGVGNLVGGGSRAMSIGTAVNQAASGAHVNVAAGTYAESVNITKALTLDGAGTGQSIIDPTSGNAVTVSGNIGANSTVLIDGFTFRDAPSAGVSVEGNTVLGQLTVQNSEFRGNGVFGFTANGSATAGIPGLANVSLLNSTFEGNGAPSASATSLGQGDIHFNYYNGNATLKDLTITGNTEHTGIHFRGYHNASTNAVYDAGTWVFENITLNGSFRRPDVPNTTAPYYNSGTWNPGGPGHAIHIFEYDSVANVSFNNVKLNQTVGHGMFLEGLSSTLNIGNTTFSAPDRTVMGSGVGRTYSMNIVSGSNDLNNVKTNVDATHAIFTGAASGFDIEDRVGHALDATGLGLVRWNANNLYVTQTSGSVQRAIDAASVGNTVNVAAGTYGGFRVNVAGLTVLGDRGDLTTAGPGLRAPVINTCYQGIVCSGVLISAENVTLSGFDISNASGPYGVQIGEINGARANGATLSYNRIHGVNGVNSGDGIRAVEVEPASNVTIKYNLIEDISPTNAAAASSGKSVAGIFVRSAGGAFSDIAIEDNIIRNISISGATGINGSKGIWVGGSAGNASVAGLTIRRNQIAGVRSNLGAEGILVNHGKNSTGTTSGLLLSGNTISDVVGAASSHGIELSGATPNALVTQNDINLASSTAADSAGVYFDSNANANSSASTVKVSGNRLTGTGYGVTVTGGSTVNASGNWWGTTSESGVLAKTSGSVDISPFLMSGTDTDLGTAGFQGNTSNLAVSTLGAQTGSTGRIEEGISLGSAGGTLNINAGSYGENVSLGSLRNLNFAGATLQGLTLNAGAAGSGIGGQVTVNGNAGITFNAAVNLLADTTLVTNGSNISLNGDVQNAGSSAHALTLTAGTGSSRGDVSLSTGGAEGNSLGVLDVKAKQFSLANTLRVNSYTIDAKGDVALSNSTLKATASGVTSSLTAGGNVTGSTTSAGGIVLNSDGNVAANVAAGGTATVSGRNVSGAISGASVAATAQQTLDAAVTAGTSATLSSDGNVAANVSAGGLATVSGRNVSGSISGSSVTATAQQTVDATVTAGNSATLTGREVRGSVNASTLTARADTTMNLALDVASADLYAGTRADLSGRAGRVVVESKNSYFSGSFPAVEGKGTGVPFINGVPQRDEQKVPPAAVIVRPPVIVLPPLPPLAPPPPPAPVTSYASADLPSLPPTAAGAPGGTGGGTSPAATGGTGSSGGSGNGAGTGSSSSGGGNGTTGNGSTSSSGGASEGSGSSSTGSTSSGGGGSSSGGATGGGGSGRVAVAAASGPRQVTVTRNAPGKAAGDSLDRGQGVEVDLSPGR